MYDLTRFKLRDMTECGAALRKLGSGSFSMEEVATRIVGYLYEHLGDKQTGEKSCVLIRFFKTHPYDELDAELRDFACGMLDCNSLSPRIKCLTLLATAGARPEWNSRQKSTRHKALPLVSSQVVAKYPMISQLIKQFGLDIGTFLEPESTIMIDLEQKTYNVFYVPEAAGSPYVPAQEEFVIPYQIKSVLGFGGMLPSGNLLAIIMFSKVQIPWDTADMFKTLALNAKLAVLPFDRGAVFG
jgi:hypothetical protein